MSTINLDTDQLGTLYIPFQASDSQTLWNDDNGWGSIFVSQGSQYALKKPSGTSTTAPITDTDLLDSIVNFTKAVVAQIESTDPSLANSLSSWCQGIQNGNPTEVYAVDGWAKHIYDDSGEADNAELTYSFVYCDPLETALLMLHEVTITWASDSDHPYSTLLGFGDKTGSAADHLTSLVEHLGEAAAEVIPGLDVIVDIGIACTVVEKVGAAVVDDEDDGGKLNFLGVLAHAVIRTSSCVTPSSAPATQMPVLQPAKVTAAWYNTVVHGTPGQSGVLFGTGMPASYVYGGNPQTTVYNQPYVANMPEISWSQGAVPYAFATVKVYSDSQAINSAAEKEHLYALASLVYTPGANMVSTTLQCTTATGDLEPTSPTWFTSDNGSSINSEYNSALQNAIAATTANTVASNQLIFVLPGFLNALLKAMPMTSISAFDWAKGLQPLVNSDFNWTIASSPYDQGNAPSVAVQNNGTVVSSFDYASNVHLDPNISELRANCGTVSGNQVSWPNANKGDKYDGGSWPTIATNPNYNNNILDFHNGGTNNIYYETGAVSSGPNIKFTGSGTEGPTDGDHPGLYLGWDNLVIIFYAPGNNNMAYNIATFDGTTVTPTDSSTGWAGTPYQCGSPVITVPGDYPTVTRHDNGVLEVHNEGGDIWYNFGTLSGDKTTISWQPGPFPLMQKGSHPHLTYCGGGYFVLTYDNAGTIYAATGYLDQNGMHWYVTNLEFGKGNYPGVCAVPNQGQKVVMCYNKSGGYNGDLYSAVGTFTVPS